MTDQEQKNIKAIMSNLMEEVFAMLSTKDMVKLNQIIEVNNEMNIDREATTNVICSRFYINSDIQRQKVYEILSKHYPLNKK